MHFCHMQIRYFKLQNIFTMKALKFISYCAIGWLSILLLPAQSGIHSAGSHADGNEGRVDYSVGQLFYLTKTADSGSTTEGVQQTYEVTMVNTTEHMRADLEMVVYPNPTQSGVFVKTEFPLADGLSLHLFDLEGKMLDSKRLTPFDLQVPMDHLIPGTYLLVVSDGKNTLKSFKIVKN